MALLGDGEVAQRLDTLDGWRREGDRIVRQYELADFRGSVAFVNALTEPAEKMGHHPDLVISWNRVTVSLSTHSEGGLTAADFEFAAKIDRLG